MKQHLVRLERVAGALNVWLLAVAIGLAMLDATVLVAKSMPPQPTSPAAVAAEGPGQVTQSLPR